MFLLYHIYFETGIATQRPLTERPLRGIKTLPGFALLLPAGRFPG
jgi:hypothetical protein